MSFISTVREAVIKAAKWLNEVPDAPAGYPDVFPDGRQRQAAVTTERALSLSTVYRGIQIHATAACQLSIAVERDGEIIPTPALVQRPDIDETRSAFIEYTVVSLYVDGNAFWRIIRNEAGQVVNLVALNPHEVSVNVEYDRHNNETVTFGWRGLKLTRRDVKHLQLLRIPGLRRGLGPIQAAQIEVRGALDARDYGAMWLTDSNMPDGVLSTDQELAPGDTTKYKNVWYGRNPDGTTITDAPDKAIGERLRVLGKGLSYTPLLLKPSDVQFLETQQYSTIQMARLIGAPASIMLVAVEGSSETYSNVEQEWIGYVRFSLMKPLREIEEALTELLPGKQTARFKIDALLRSDTKTRYEAHGMSLDPQKGWATADEVRALEGMAPLTDAQRAELDARKTTTKTPEAANA
ncbi:phage portal protein [Microbacterium sp. K2]|uniref:phage portal protein n=1 Tax=Microbacterium sp. K2 TaxID=3391827 RepID=UPI003ED8493C